MVSKYVKLNRNLKRNVVDWISKFTGRGFLCTIGLLLGCLILAASGLGLHIFLVIAGEGGGTIRGIS